MPIPFETLLPYGIMIAMFGVTGTGLAALKSYQNEGRNPRYSLDQWDKVRMLRVLSCAYDPIETNASSLCSKVSHYTLRTT
jgi:hypothetical protein